MLLPLFLPLPARAAQRFPAGEGEDLARAAQEYLAGYLPARELTGGDFAAGARTILESGAGELAPALRRAGRSGALLLAVALLCGLSQSVEDTIGSAGGLDPARLAGAAAIAVIASGDVHTLMGLGRQALERMDLFSKTLLPAAAAACAAAGAPVAAAARQSATLLFLSLLLTLVNTLVIPLVYAYTAAATAAAAVGNGGLKRLCALLKTGSAVLLTGLVTVFVLFLSITGAVSGSADALAQKAAKTALSNMVPVVGGILADASETVIAGAGQLRGTVGVVGLLTVLAICLVPFLRLACHYLVYKCAAALADTVTPGPMAGLIDAIGSAFALMLGMTGAGAAILYISLIISMQAVTV